VASIGIVARDGCVGAYDFFTRDDGGEGDVLADGQAERVCWAWKGEAVSVEDGGLA
jgi:hypothetical protein